MVVSGGYLDGALRFWDFGFPIFGRPQKEGGEINPLFQVENRVFGLFKIPPLVGVLTPGFLEHSV